MTDDQVRAVCARYRVAVFARPQGLARGLSEAAGGPTPRMTALHGLLGRLRCGSSD